MGKKNRVLFGLSVCLASLGCFESGLGRSFMVLPGTCVSALGFSFGPSQPVGGNVFCVLFHRVVPCPDGKVLSLA